MKLLKFSASWCDPCKMLSRTMDGMDFPVSVESMDIDEHQVLARTYGIRGVPTVLLVDATGKVLKRFSGVKSKGEIEAWLGDVYE
jgi:thioredoxin 1